VISTLKNPGWSQIILGLVAITISNMARSLVAVTQRANNARKGLHASTVVAATLISTKIQGWHRHRSGVSGVSAGASQTN